MNSSRGPLKTRTKHTESAIHEPKECCFEWDSGGSSLYLGAKFLDGHDEEWVAIFDDHCRKAGAKDFNLLSWQLHLDQSSR